MSAGLRIARVAPGMRMGRFWAGVGAEREVVVVDIVGARIVEEVGWAVIVAEDIVLDESLGVRVSRVLKVGGRAGPSI